jgi:regulator of protease activity HflC (stomatin/prohibitin superfamily)
MTSGDKTQVGQVSADEAMNRVLAAERDARLAVAECRAEAARLIAAAEARARALAGLSEAHIKAAQRLADAAIARALADLAQTPLPDQDQAADQGSGGAADRGPEAPGAISAPLAQALEALVGEILGDKA